MRVKIKKDLLTPLLLWSSAVIISALGERILEGNSGSLAAVTAAVAIRGAVAIFIPVGTFYLYRYLKNGGSDTPVFAAAIALEIIYDAALFGKPFENSRQNPALALCICCIGAFLFERYREKRAVFFLVGAACILWAAIIRADHGIPVALSFFILELTQKKTAARPLALAAALSLCTVASPFCALSPLGALFVRSDDQRLR